MSPIATPSDAVTYAEVGASLHDPLPTGYHHVIERRVVGHAQDAFNEAAEGLFTWQVHRRAGLRVITNAERVAVGTRLTSVLGILGRGVKAPCVVVAVIEEPARVGWAYGTLPGHPECGEEAFLLTLEPTGAVVFEVRAFSRPGNWLGKLAGPGGRALQQWVTQRYLRALDTASARPIDN